MRFLLSTPFLRKSFCAFPPKPRLRAGFLTHASGLESPLPPARCTLLPRTRYLRRNGLPLTALGVFIRPLQTARNWHNYAVDRGCRHRYVVTNSAGCCPPRRPAGAAAWMISGKKSESLVRLKDRKERLKCQDPTKQRAVSRFRKALRGAPERDDSLPRAASPLHLRHPQDAAHILPLRPRPAQYGDWTAELLHVAGLLGMEARVFRDS